MARSASQSPDLRESTFSPGITARIRCPTSCLAGDLSLGFQDKRGWEYSCTDELRDAAFQVFEEGNGDKHQEIAWTIGNAPSLLLNAEPEEKEQALPMPMGGGSSIAHGDQHLACFQLCSLTLVPQVAAKVAAMKGMMARRPKRTYGALPPSRRRSMYAPADVPPRRMVFAYACVL
jgi:hypothetical protein